MVIHRETKSLITYYIYLKHPVQLRKRWWRKSFAPLLISKIDFNSEITTLPIAPI